MIIVKEASAGYENDPTVILQGHLDMVCEKNPDCPLDMAREGLRLRTDGAWIWADGTTLGGDDGIAIAMTMAILADDTLPHPRLEAVFTTDEETGMTGAEALDMSMLRGRLLLSMDSDKEGILTVACAGGIRANCRLPISWEEAEGYFAGGTVDFAGDYPAWEYQKTSAFRDLVVDAYRKQTGKDPVIQIIHAGLECGIFSGKLPGLDCVALGPNLMDTHTPRERMEVASVARTYELVLELLSRVKEL